MSITFFCPDAPSKIERVPCDSPSMGLTCTPEERCGYCDDGWMDQYVTECPEVNFANQNALDILGLLGLPVDYCGEIPVEDIPSVLQRCMVVLALPEKRKHLIRDSWEGPAHEPRVVEEDGLARISTGCHVVISGNSDERVVARIETLRNLLVWAHEHGYSVNWG